MDTPLRWIWLALTLLVTPRLASAQALTWSNAVERAGRASPFVIAERVRVEEARRGEREAAPAVESAPHGVTVAAWT
jgi:hypothetical protein